MDVQHEWPANSFFREQQDGAEAESRYRAVMIDQGYCFNAGEWNFPDSPLRGVYSRNYVYAQVSGWHSFEPWLSRIENFDPNLLSQLSENIPPKWFGEWEDLEKLVQQLVTRRA